MHDVIYDTHITHNLRASPMSTLQMNPRIVRTPAHEKWNSPDEYADTDSGAGHLTLSPKRLRMFFLSAQHLK